MSSLLYWHKVNNSRLVFRNALNIQVSSEELAEPSETKQAEDTEEVDKPKEFSLEAIDRIPLPNGEVMHIVRGEVDGKEENMIWGTDINPELLEPDDSRDAKLRWGAIRSGKFGKAAFIAAKAGSAALALAGCNVDDNYSTDTHSDTDASHPDADAIFADSTLAHKDGALTVEQKITKADLENIKPGEPVVWSEFGDDYANLAINDNKIFFDQGNQIWFVGCDELKNCFENGSRQKLEGLPTQFNYYHSATTYDDLDKSKLIFKVGGGGTYKSDSANLNGTYEELAPPWDTSISFSAGKLGGNPAILGNSNSGYIRDLTTGEDVIISSNGNAMSTCGTPHWQDGGPAIASRLMGPTGAKKCKLYGVVLEDLVTPENPNPTTLDALKALESEAAFPLSKLNFGVDKSMSPRFIANADGTFKGVLYVSEAFNSKTGKNETKLFFAEIPQEYCGNTKCDTNENSDTCAEDCEPVVQPPEPPEDVGQPDAEEPDAGKPDPEDVQQPIPDEGQAGDTNENIDAEKSDAENPIDDVPTELADGTLDTDQDGKTDEDSQTNQDTTNEDAATDTTQDAQDPDTTQPPECVDVSQNFFVKTPGCEIKVCPKFLDEVPGERIDVSCEGKIFEAEFRQSDILENGTLKAETTDGGKVKFSLSFFPDHPALTDLLVEAEPGLTPHIIKHGHDAGIESHDAVVGSTGSDFAVTERPMDSSGNRIFEITEWNNPGEPVTYIVHPNFSVDIQSTAENYGKTFTVNVDNKENPIQEIPVIGPEAIPIEKDTIPVEGTTGAETDKPDTSETPTEQPAPPGKGGGCNAEGENSPAATPAAILTLLAAGLLMYARRKPQPITAQEAALEARDAHIDGMIARLHRQDILARLQGVQEYAAHEVNAVQNGLSQIGSRVKGFLAKVSKYMPQM